MLVSDWRAIGSPGVALDLCVTHWMTHLTSDSLTHFQLLSRLFNERTYPYSFVFMSALETQRYVVTNTAVCTRFCALQSGRIELKLYHSVQNGLNVWVDYFFQ